MTLLITLLEINIYQVNNIELAIIFVSMQGSQVSTSIYNVKKIPRVSQLIRSSPSLSPKYFTSFPDFAIYPLVSIGKTGSTVHPSVDRGW